MRQIRSRRFAAACLLSAVLGAVTASAAPREGSFLHVVEDDSSAERLGVETPRALYALLLERLPVDPEGAVALKFFLFDDRDPEEDRRLAEAISRHRTLSQYALRADGPRAAGPLRDAVAVFPEGTAAPPGLLLEASRSEFPTDRFLEALTSVGFVDVVEPFDADRVPLLGRAADGRVVKSLTLALLEVAHGPARLDVEAGSGRLSIGDARLDLDDRGRVTCPARDTEIEALPIEDLLADPASRPGEGRIVVVSYGGAQSPTFSLGWFDSIGAHDLFFQRLACLDHAITAH